MVSNSEKYDIPIHGLNKEKSKTKYNNLSIMSFTKQIKEEGLAIKESTEDAIKTITREGLQHPRAVVFLILWYFFSASTLFLNKYILSYLKLDPYLLCGFQMFITSMCGAIQLKYPLGVYTPVKGQVKPSNFIKTMFTLGFLQLCTILFGLVALYFVAVSFAETVKSTAPIVTVIVAFLLRGERTSIRVMVTLIPVMAGLALCSSGELSFSLMGLLCALLTNLSEVLQSVMVKTVLSDTTYKYNPAELLFYPCMVGAILQVVLCLFLVPRSALHKLTDTKIIVTVLLDGISYHGQTITACVLITYISTVTYSVANTTKRAVLIWLSVLIFGNPITISSGVGTFMVLGGVLLYGKVRDLEQVRRMQLSVPEQMTRRYN